MPLDELAKNLEVVRERILQQARQVEAIADQLLGPPAKVPGPGGHMPTVDPPRMGKLNNLNELAQYVHNCVTDLQNQIDRLTVLTG